MYRYRHRNPHQDDQHLDRWLVSYADYMTLMFALFVVLYALALAREGSLPELTRHLGDLFHEQSAQAEPNPNSGLLTEASDEILNGHGVHDETGPNIVDAKSEIVNLNKKHQGSSLSNLENQLNEALQELLHSGYADLEQQDDWLVLSLNSNLIFASGSAVASKNLTTLMPSLMKVLAPSDNYVRVRGYTDSSPINNELFSSNWQLSAARAGAVLEALIAAGMRSELMAMEAYGSNVPRADNQSASGRAANRRVEIAISKWGAVIDPEVLDMTPATPTVAPEPSTKPPEAKVAESTDYEKMQLIPLANGGFRITTRREPKPSPKQVAKP